MYTKKDVINFINNFKARDGMENGHTIEEFFLNGGCYWFARILQCRFPQGKILYDLCGNHFLFYGGYSLNIEEEGIFDIRGEVTEAYLPWLLQGIVVEWDRYDDTAHKSRIWRDCIAFEEVK